jgi:hypothetical protein
MKMVGSARTTLLLSEIVPAYAGPLRGIFEAKNVASSFDAASSSVSGDGHTAALANQISFSRMTNVDVCAGGHG